jgi:lipid-binding SYLF domain-containing protein
MKRVLTVFLMAMMVTGFAPAAFADATPAECAEAAKLFQNAGQSSAFFPNSYGYAIYPTIGKAAFGVGGAHGSGCVFAKGKQIGTTAMTQLSFGWQAGAEGYALILFFQDERSFREFAGGNFEFGAKASATAITASASAGAGTTGAGAGASATKKTAATAGAYYKGVAPFSIVKGGLMYEAALSGAKFSYKPM